MKNIRWGILGCGDVTEVKSGPAFQKAEGSELIAVMRRTGELAADYAERHGVSKWYDNAMDLINDPEVDAVYVATPPSSHMAYVIAAAEAGKPVYVEKPMARTYEECQKMISACKKAEVPLFVAYYRRGLPRFIKIKDLLEQKVIGDIRYVTMRQHKKVRDNELLSDKPWRVIPDIAGGGKFLDLASHTLDIMAYLIGDVTEVLGNASNQGGNYEAEDITTGHFVFDDHIHGVGTWCFTAFNDEDMNEIVGSEGKFRFSTFGTEPIELITQEGIQYFDIKHPRHIQEPLIQMIVDELQAIGKSPSTGMTASKTSRVMDQLLEAYRNRD